MNTYNTTDDEEERAEFARLLQREMMKLRLTELEVAMRAAGEPTTDWKRLPAVGTVTDTLDMALEVKSSDDATGVVTGYLSTWDIDLGHDQILPGAYQQTIADATAAARRNGSMALFPFLWQHQKDEPIGGIVAAREDRKGLLIHVKLNMRIERGRQAYDGFQQGYLSFSIGYKPVKYSWKGNIRRMEEIRLAEGSAVTFPMNQEARAIPQARANGAQ
jgi:Escherichia/Staphylococcus phage prohead protease